MAEDFDDESKPWERMPKEPTHWFRRFKRFVEQEVPRSLLSVYRGEIAKGGVKRRGKKPLAEVINVPHTWRAARDRYFWLQRAEAYDRWQEQEEARKKVEARRRQEETELTLADLLYRKAMELLAFPTTIKEEQGTGEDGKPIKILMMPADPMTFRSAALLSREARTSARASLKMPLHYRQREEAALLPSGAAKPLVIILPPNFRDLPLHEALALMGEETEDGEVVQSSPEPLVKLPDRQEVGDEE